eukprot:551423-Pyramimonas_sp.AAC.2
MRYPRPQRTSEVRCASKGPFNPRGPPSREGQQRLVHRSTALCAPARRASARWASRCTTRAANSTASSPTSCAKAATSLPATAPVESASLHPATYPPSYIMPIVFL